MHASTFCHAEECYMAPREHKYDKGKKRHAVGGRGNKKKRRTYIPTVLDELIPIRPSLKVLASLFNASLIAEQVSNAAASGTKEAGSLEQVSAVANLHVHAHRAKHTFRV